MHSNISSAKRQPFCLGLNELIWVQSSREWVLHSALKPLSVLSEQCDVKDDILQTKLPADWLIYHEHLMSMTSSKQHGTGNGMRYHTHLMSLSVPINNVVMCRTNMWWCGGQKSLGSSHPIDVSVFLYIVNWIKVLHSLAGNENGDRWENGIWARSWNCGCLVTWLCYQLIAKPGNKTAPVPWPDPYIYIPFPTDYGLNVLCFLH